MHSPEQRPEETPLLPPKAEYVGTGYIIFFPTADVARDAVINFWSELSPAVKNLIERGVHDPVGNQITDGMRTEFVPVRSERKAVFFSGNGNPLSTQALEALIRLNYLSL